MADVTAAAYDEDTDLLVLETVQQFHLHWSPFKLAPARLVTNITFEQDPDTGLHYIAYQVLGALPCFQIHTSDSLVGGLTA
jgi:hypothetical protein